MSDDHAPGGLDHPDVVAFHNAAHLAADVSEALTRWELHHRAHGDGPATAAALVEPIYTVLTSTPRVMGQTGRITRRVDQPGRRAPMYEATFTAAQCLAMAEFLADAMPELALKARQAQEAVARPAGAVPPV